MASGIQQQTAQPPISFAFQSIAVITKTETLLYTNKLGTNKDWGLVCLLSYSLPDGTRPLQRLRKYRSVSQKLHFKVFGSLLLSSLFGAKTPPSCDRSYCSIRANCRSSVKAFWTIYSYLPTRTWYLISPSVHRHFQKIFDLRWSSDLRGWRSQQSSWNAQQHQSQNVLFFPLQFFVFVSLKPNYASLGTGVLYGATMAL